LGGTPQESPTPAEEAAAAVALVYCTDAEPGIRRTGPPMRFDYRLPDGARVTDADTLERIRALAIPPAWTEVWIALDPDAHLQATGKDVRGRKQYRYHERWTACRDEVKYGNLSAFARALPRLRKAVDADLRRRGLGRERALATVVWLLDNTMIRVGNAAYARDNKSFGLTTFRDRHVRVEGATMRFAFRGKSGKEWNLRITDRRIARCVKSMQDLPGQHLFQYLDEDGERRAITSQDVNAHIRAAGGGPFTSKHFRTWGGTVHAAVLLAGEPVPDARRGRAAALNRVVDAVSGRLGNTRSVCRKCYIHPRVAEHWEAGRLGDEIAALRRRYRRAPDGLDRAEHLVLRWLESLDAEEAAG
jgi:DNA topoisomerase-1